MISEAAIKFLIQPCVLNMSVLIRREATAATLIIVKEIATKARIIGLGFRLGLFFWRKFF